MGIYMLPVNMAFARRKPGGNGVSISLYHPSDAQPLTGRLKKVHPHYFVKAYEALMKTGNAQIASGEYPLRSPSGGTMYVLENGRFFLHRRSDDAPTHKGWLGTQTAFPSNEDEAIDPRKTIRRTAELILVTKNKPHRLIVPPNEGFVKEESIRAAQLIGLDTSVLAYAYFDFAGGPDTLSIYQGGSQLNKIDGCVQWFSDKETGLSFLEPCYIKFDPEDVLPIDVQGEMKPDFVHLKRDTFILSPDEVQGAKWGSVLKGPAVYSTRMEEGPVPVQAEPDYTAYFKPDDNAMRLMAAIGATKGAWLVAFKEFHDMAASGKLE